MLFEFQNSILLTSVHHSSSKLKRTFMLMIKRAKESNLVKALFITYLPSKLGMKHETLQALSNGQI